jgi:hypothetical protein
MSNPNVTAAVEHMKESGHSSSNTAESKKTKVDVTISDAPAKAKGTNGDYSLHMTPLKDHKIPYYQGIQGSLFQMFIIYNETEKRWELQNSIGTESERRFGLIAYIACDIEDAKKTYLASVSGKKEWYVPNTPGDSDGVLDPNMVADVKSGGEPDAAAEAPTELSSTAAAAASASVPTSPPVVVTAPTKSDMKKILKYTDTEYTTITGKLTTLNSATVPADIQQFDKELDTAKANLKGAQDKLDAFRKGVADADAATGARLEKELAEAGRNTDFSGGSSSSKKNRKSHKSYHPGIGKTRKHHSHSEPKRISFVHQA